MQNPQLPSLDQDWSKFEKKRKMMDAMILWAEEERECVACFQNSAKSSKIQCVQ